MIWPQLAISFVMMVLSVAINYAIAPRPQKNDATVGTSDIPLAKAGETIPVVFGTVLQKSPIIIDYFDPKTAPIYSDGGGK